MIVTIGGNIGSGKSTVIRKINYNTICEPINEWGEWLTKFYKKQKKYAFGFQMKVLLEFCKMDTSRPVIIERSAYDALHVFGKALLQDKMLTEMEYSLFEDYVKQFAWKPDVYIYINTSSSTCMKRIQTRNRNSETGISMDYLNKIENNHTTLIEHLPQVHIVDGEQTEQRVLEEVNEILKMYITL